MQATEIRRRLVLITGSNARIGTAVMKQLRKRFDLSAPEPPPTKCVRIAIDIVLSESVRDRLRMLRDHHGPKVAAAVHFATCYDSVGKPTPTYDQFTVEIRRRLLLGLRDDIAVEESIFRARCWFLAQSSQGISLMRSGQSGPLGLARVRGSNRVAHPR